MSYVYIMANANHPDLSKVGYTDRHPNERAVELYGYADTIGTWYPAHYWNIAKGHAQKAENAVHRALASLRKGGTELFRLPADKAIERSSKVLVDANYIDKASKPVASNMDEFLAWQKNWQPYNDAWDEYYEEVARREAVYQQELAEHYRKINSIKAEIKGA